MRLATTALERHQLCKLVQCVRADDRSAIRRLIEGGGVDDLINLVSPTSSDDLPLAIAATENRDELVGFLLDMGAHPDVVDGHQRTAIMQATKFGHVQSVKRLVNHRITPNLMLIDDEGKGVLFYCVAPTRRHEQCAEVILERDVDVNNCSHSGTPVLVHACETAIGNEQICLMLLRKGADPNSKDQRSQRSALVAAASSGSSLIVGAILQRGGDVDYVVARTGTRAAHAAAMNGHLDVLRVLSAYSASFDQEDETGNSPMHYAAAGGHGLCVRFLAQRGCNPKRKNHDGLTARLLARNLGHKEATKECRRAEASHGKSAKNAESWALSFYDFVCVHQSGFQETFQKLDADRSGKITRDDFLEVIHNECSMLKLSEEANFTRIAHTHEKGYKMVDYVEFLTGRKYINKLYLRAAYEPKEKKRTGKSAAGKRGMRRPHSRMPVCTRDEGPRTDDGGPPEIYFRLDDHRTDLRRFNRDSRPKNPIEDDSSWYLGHSRSPRVHVRELIRKHDLVGVRAGLGLVAAEGPSEEGIDEKKLPAETIENVDLLDRFYKTPLMMACADGDIDLVKMLVKSGANVNARDNFYWTPLHMACYSGMRDCVEFLLDSGANIDDRALNGATPLMRAIQSSQPEIVRLLIERGATVRVETRAGETPNEFASLYANSEVYAIVQQKLSTLPPLPKDNAKTRGTVKSMSDKRPRSSAATSEFLTKTPAERSLKSLSARSHQPLTVTTKSLLKSDILSCEESIAFYPATASTWSNVPSTQHLIAERVRRRSRYGWEIDFHSLRPPVFQNAINKAVQLGDVVNASGP